MSTSLTRRISLLLLLSGLAVPLHAQGISISIQPDIRVFSVLAALHEAGLEAESRSSHPVRSSIDEDLKAIPPGLKEKLRKYVQDHLEGKEAEDQIAKYVSLALLTEGPPDYKLTLETKDLPPDALSVVDFLGLVKEFYVAGKVEAVWSRHRAYYDQAVIDYRPQIDNIILLTDGYLRIVSGSFLDRRLVIIPDFLAGPNTFNSRSYRENYYLVFGPSDKLASDEFRHQYLHFLLDPYALRFTLPKETRLELSKFIETAPGIEEQYRSDLQLTVTESLIRAVELRMNKVPEPRATEELDAAIRAGGVLARQFYKSLQAFEESPEGIRLFYPKMVKDIVAEQVTSDFAEAQKTAVVVQKPPPREPTEVEKLLRDANTSLGNSNLASAAEQFQKVLESHDAANAEALYGLGIVASIQNRRDIAKDYFSRALQSPSSDKAIKVWAHIYLGRIFDLEDNRQNALQQYQSAIDVGDNTRNAQEVAQHGLKEPFSARKPSPSP
jgi:tetratricopeptide (TPR) repeat protein